MSISLNSVSLTGINGEKINVEVEISKGMPLFNIVGLCNREIRESKVRIKTAIENSGLKFPLGKITVNLAPANTKKRGTYYDLPIALAILSVCYHIPLDQISEHFIFGELSLSGKIRGVQGSMTVVKSLVSKGFYDFILPWEDSLKCSLVTGANLYPFKTLKEAFTFMRYKDVKPLIGTTPSLNVHENNTVDMDEIFGSYNAKRALEVAASGRHNLLIIGPPGSGKTMLADRFHTLLPPLNYTESLEVSSIYDSLGLLKKDQLINTPPVRRPHTTISKTGLIGGGSKLSPGEISLAHKGVLLIDEFLEFSKGTLDVLRQPLEDKYISLNRNLKNAEYPCDFTLLGTSNMCPCGNLGSSNSRCTCSQSQILRYQRKITGAMLDRFDMVIYLDNKPCSMKSDSSGGESSATIRKRVCKVLETQLKRNSGSFNTSLTLKDFSSNNWITPHSIKKFFAREEIYNSTNRGVIKTLKLARTLADMDCSTTIEDIHLYEALSYRNTALSQMNIS